MNPYFLIAAPNWTPASAGVRAVHQLCHEINRRGQSAWIPPVVKSPDLCTPIADLQRLKNRDWDTCIAVYPEGIHGNPFDGDIVARWLLNTQRHNWIGKDDLIFSWINDYDLSGRENHRLRIDVVDEDIFHNHVKHERKGRCLYANKFRAEGGVIAPELLEGSLDLSTVEPGDWETLAEIFRRSEYLICFERSTITTEASLCGCPIVYVLSESLPNIPGTKAREPSGSTTYLTPRSIKQASETLHLLVKNYKRHKEEASQQIDNFIKVCLERANHS